MSASINKVTIVGNLGGDPEIRSLGGDERVANFRVATSETWRDRETGERKEATEWHRVVVFNEHFVKTVERMLKKGTTVYLEGQLKTRKWTDNAGVEKYSTEIVIPKFGGELKVLTGGKGRDDQSEG